MPSDALRKRSTRLSAPLLTTQILIIMTGSKIREVSSHRLKEAIIYTFMKNPDREFTLVEVSFEVLKYFGLEDETIPENEIGTYRQRLHKALSEKIGTGLISSRTAKNSIIKNYLLYKLARS